MFYPHTNIAFYCPDNQCQQRLAMIQNNYFQECRFCGQRWPISNLAGKYIELDISYLNEGKILNNYEK